MTALCELCGGEGVIDGLVIDDRVVTEKCAQCGGTGVATMNERSGA